MAPTDVMTEEEYLLRETEAEYKSEFREGRVVAMGGASLAHSLLTMNLSGELHRQLKERPCTAYHSDTRIKVANAHFYTYPDLSVVCGKPQVDPRESSTVLNPTVIIEVLSPSTEAYDRGQKFKYYQKLESLREYILVAQDRVHVESYARQGDGEWSKTTFDSLEDVLVLDAIQCRLALRDIYDKV